MKRGSGLVVRVAVAGILLATCGREVTGPEPVVSVSVTPAADTVYLGGNIQLVATPRNAGGAALMDRAVTWSSAPSTVAEVSPAGAVTGLALGPATVTATSEGQSGTAQILVAPVPVTSVTVAPGAPTIPFGGTVQLTATLRDSATNVLTGRVVTWTSSDTSRATVSAGGLVTGIHADGGSATLTASSEGQAGTAQVTVQIGPADTVTVSPPADLLIVGTTRQLVAAPRDSFGHALTGRVVIWSNGDAAIASVDVNGLVTANDVGSTFIGVSSGAAVGQAAITVVPVPVATVIVEPSTDSLLPGENVVLTLTTLDSTGDTLAGRAATWSSDNPTVVSISPAPYSATVTAEFTTGVAHVVATVEGKVDTATITVIPPVATVTVEPSSDSVHTGDAIQLTATARDAAGNPLAGRPISWATSDTTIATVSPGGLVGGVRPGYVYVQATSAEGPSGYATVIVLAPVDSVWVTTPADTVISGDSAFFYALTYDSAGGEIFGRTVSWVSSDPSVATVDSVGNAVTARGLAPGTSLLIATSEGVSDTATFVVQPVPVEYVVVTPDTAIRSIGDTVRFTAVALDIAFNPLPGRVVTWSTSDPARASVDPTGLVTALGSDRSRIIATVEGVADTATLLIPLSLQGMSAAGEFTCGFTSGGVASCWGTNVNGQLGGGTAIAGDSFPYPVAGGVLLRPVSAGAFHACGVASGAVYCWGNNGYGQLGTGSTASTTAPAPVTGGLTLRAVAAGGTHTCALTSADLAYCWGRNQFGQLGSGSGTLLDSMPQAVGGGLTFGSISAGGVLTCAVTTTNVAYCWGRGVEGQLGNGSTGPQSLPSAVSGGFAFKQVSAAGGHACAVTTANVAYCWGDNTYGQLGTGTTAPDSVPQPVAGGLAFSSIATGTFHTCGLTPSGVAYCWGLAGGGRLGNGATAGQETAPVVVLGGLTFNALSAGSFHTCGHTTGGEVYCWGTGSMGQLGNGGTQSSAVPLPVVNRPD